MGGRNKVGDVETETKKKKNEGEKEKREKKFVGNRRKLSQGGEK